MGLTQRCRRHTAHQSTTVQKHVCAPLMESSVYTGWKELRKASCARLQKTCERGQPYLPQALAEQQLRVVLEGLLVSDLRCPGPKGHLHGNFNAFLQALPRQKCLWLCMQDIGLKALM